MLLLAILASGYAVSSALRTRAEESADRLEPVLATAVSRYRWLGGTLLVTLLGSKVVVPGVAFLGPLPLALAGINSYVAMSRRISNIGSFLGAATAGYAPEIHVRKTTGDKRQDVSLATIGASTGSSDGTIISLIAPAVTRLTVRA